jgi:CHAD domain-containing protein
MVRASVFLQVSEARGLLASDDPFSSDNVHDIRVVIKRLRSFWLLEQPLIGAKRRRGEDRRLRELGRLLSHCRDTHVLLNTLQAVGEMAATVGEQESVDLCHRILEAEIAGQDDGFPEPCTFDTGFVTEEMLWKELSDPAGDAEILSRGLTRTYAQARRRGAQALEASTAHAYHRWRRWVKYLRYQIEVVADMDRSTLDPIVQGLDELGDLLGWRNDLNNLVVALESRSRDGLRKRDVRRIGRIVSRRQDEIDERSRALHGLLFALSPRKFLRQLDAAYEKYRLVESGRTLADLAD